MAFNIKLNAMKIKKFGAKSTYMIFVFALNFSFCLNLIRAQNSISYKKDHDVVSYFLLGLHWLNTVEAACKNLHFLNSGKNGSCVLG